MPAVARPDSCAAAWLPKKPNKEHMLIMHLSGRAMQSSPPPGSRLASCTGTARTWLAWHALACCAMGRPSRGSEPSMPSVVHGAGWPVSAHRQAPPSLLWGGRRGLLHGLADGRERPSGGFRKGGVLGIARLLCTWPVMHQVPAKQGDMSQNLVHADLAKSSQHHAYGHQETAPLKRRA